MFALFLTACQSDVATESTPPYETGIVGGTVVNSNSPLALKALFFKAFFDPVITKQSENATVTNYKVSQCTSAAIGPRILLTAAHCIPPQPKMLQVEVPLPQGKLITIKGTEASVHPDYPKDQDADLALVLLAEDLPAEVKILKLPNPQVDLYFNTITALGFGRITGNPQMPGYVGILRTVALDIFSYSPQESSFNTDQSMGQGICQGDSGGPAIVNYENQSYVVGVVSRTVYFESKDTCNYQGIYVNLQYYLEKWLRPAMTKLLAQ